MKNFGDFLLVVVLAVVGWCVTGLIVFALTSTLFDVETTELMASVVATVVAIGIIVFWIKGRSLSSAEQLTEQSQEPSDFEVVVDYGSLFEDLDTSRFIYDERLLPHPKERILSAALRVLDRKDSPALLRRGAALATELSQFQTGVGATPQATKLSVMLDTNIGDDREHGVAQHARAVAGHKKSTVEIRAEEEREKLLALVGDALRRGQ